MVILANKFEEEDLEKEALKMIKDNLKELRSTEEWKTLEEKHTKIVTKLLVMMAGGEE